MLPYVFVDLVSIHGSEGNKHETSLLLLQTILPQGVAKEQWFGLCRIDCKVHKTNQSKTGRQRICVSIHRNVQILLWFGLTSQDLFGTELESKQNLWGIWLSRTNLSATAVRLAGSYVSTSVTSTGFQPSSSSLNSPSHFYHRWMCCVCGVVTMTKSTVIVANSQTNHWCSTGSFFRVPFSPSLCDGY